MVDALWTTEEVLEKAAEVRAMVRDQFEQFGAVVPTTWLYGTRHPKTGVEGDGGKGLVVVPSVGRFGRKERDMYADIIRKSAVDSKAMGVVTAIEMLFIDPDYLHTLGEERANEEQTSWIGRIKDHPHRIERVVVSLEHHRLVGQITWYALITRDSVGQPSLGDWQEEHMVGGTGRFVNILPPVN
jgi:hypothetical protein